MKIEIHIKGPAACGKTTAARRIRDISHTLFPAGAEVRITSGHGWAINETDQEFIVPANPELDEATFGAVADRVVEDLTATLGTANRQRYGEASWFADGEHYTADEYRDLAQRVAPLYDKLVAPQGRKQVTILVPERGVDGKTIRPLVVEKELNQVFGWYLATHGVRGSADAGRTPVIAYAVAVADDLGVRDAVGIAGRAAALTGAPVTVTLDTGDMVKVDAMGQFV